MDLDMSSQYDVAVIGGGIFGVEVALAAASLGLTVKIFEAKDSIMAGASKNNQNRLHLGFHYPRDLETGRQSIRGFYDFKEKYHDCVMGQFDNAYFIANEGSLTSPENYLKFCNDLGLNYKEIEIQNFPVEIHGVDFGILCEEVVYDSSLIKSSVLRELEQSNVSIALKTSIHDAQLNHGGINLIDCHGDVTSAQVVINATYSDINRLTQKLGYDISENQYEYTAVPIIELDIPPFGVTIMDGPFFTLLPYGKSGKYLLYGVNNSVIRRVTSQQMPHTWHEPKTSPFNSLDKGRFFEDMKTAVASFMPIINQSKLSGFLQGPRMVLAKNDDTDARPSVINVFEDKYMTIFSGKIDHSIWVAEEIKMFLGNKFML